MSYPTEIRCASCSAVLHGEKQAGEDLFAAKRRLRETLGARCPRVAAQMQTAHRCPMRTAGVVSGPATQASRETAEAL